MGRGRSAQVMVRRFDGDVEELVPDRLAVEEPLEVRLDGHRVATTMRTPGHDFELAAGLCLTEGLLPGPAPVVRTVRYCATGPAVDTEFNVVSVESDGRGLKPRERLGTTTSSCGICGSTAIDELRDRLRPREGSTTFERRLLSEIPDRVRADQDLFAATGGVHAAAAFDPAGVPAVVREDVGRHNAVDKVVGRLLLDGRLPATGLGLFVSGRASFEIVQKAWAAGFGTVLAVSAPSALAVEAAAAGGIALYGFARGARMNRYA